MRSVGVGEVVQPEQGRWMLYVNSVACVVGLFPPCCSCTVVIHAAVCHEYW